MSGENSKKSGEIGEALANALLYIIGWKTLLQNVPIECNTPSHVNAEGKRRTSHGEDQIFLYHSPFHDDRTDVVHVSDKNNIEKYAKGGTLKSQFKAHLKELNQTIECAKHSLTLNQLCSSYSARKIKSHSGLLIWLQNDHDDIEHDIIAELANSRIDSESEYPIYMIDNARAAFLIKVVDDLTRRATGGEFEFFYPRIGTAQSVDEKRTGKFLPLELIAADLIPALVKKGETRELVLYANQNFEVTSYERLVAYGLNFASGLVSTIHIGMPDYNPARDENLARQARMAFHERDENVTPFTFNRSILTFLQEQNK
jgi:hypothetical protein